MAAWPLSTEERLTGDLVPSYALPDHQCALRAMHWEDGDLEHKCHCGSTKPLDA